MNLVAVELMSRKLVGGTQTVEPKPERSSTDSEYSPPGTSMSLKATSMVPLAGVLVPCFVTFMEISMLTDLLATAVFVASTVSEDESSSITRLSEPEAEYMFEKARVRSTGLPVLSLPAFCHVNVKPPGSVVPALTEWS